MNEGGDLQLLGLFKFFQNKVVFSNHPKAVPTINENH